MSQQLVTLVDPVSGSSAKVLAGMGFNCFSFCPLLAGAPVELLWAAPGFESGEARPTSSGIPILFPYPGRLRGTTLHFGGRQFPLVIDPRQGVAIHGFVHNRPWRILEQNPASVTGEFHASRDEPALVALWPADFRIRVCYEVHAAELRCQLTIDNPDERPLPFGLGTHGYFRLPLAAAGDRGECRITVPAHKFWELERMLPTGRTIPASGGRALADGMPFGETRLDDVLTDLDRREGRVTCRIDDPTNDRRLSVVFDEVFRECVVFNPPHREAFCIEPYTCVPDAYALAEQGIETGLRVLGPGESFQARVDLRLEAVSKLPLPQ
jgi:aldose 1-epimerase